VVILNAPLSNGFDANVFAVKVVRNCYFLFNKGGSVFVMVLSCIFKFKASSLRLRGGGILPG
jgi:hypothetical protein